YLLHDFTCIWGRLAAEVLGLPAAAFIPQFPINLRSRPDPYPGMGRDLLANLVGGLPHLGAFHRAARRIRVRYGVGPITWMNFMANHEGLNIVFTSRYFQPRAEDFDQRFVFVGPSIGRREEASDLPLDFSPHCTGPLVYISLGSTVFSANVAFYRACFQAFAETDKRVVLSAGRWTDPGTLADAPANCIVRPYVPQLEVLQRADVFITHGGMGSVSEGLLYGVPLIIAPQAADQPFVAERIRRLGAGYVLPRRRVRPAELSRLVDAILADEGVRAKAGRIAESFRAAGGAARAAEVILERLSTGRAAPA
ncbi:MAG: glycosyl transferase family 1, partial [Anaerolineae bacterium]|nr:glycosyl transferase family 1 [Anaerolineae bacterium]